MCGVIGGIKVNKIFYEFIYKLSYLCEYVLFFIIRSDIWNI